MCLLIASILAVTSASAEQPCPPLLTGSVVESAQQCPSAQLGSTIAPDYDDPMLACSGLAGRHNVSVSSSAALQQALEGARCGDTIQLAPGTYGGSFTTDVVCPLNAPVIVQGAPDFKSTITSNITLAGARAIITGLSFSGSDARVRLGGTNNKVIANSFTDWRSIAVTTVTGNHGEIAYNEFWKPHAWLTNEVASTPLRMGIRTQENDPSTFHFDVWVHHNYFHDFPAKPNPANYDSGQSDAIEVCVTGRSSTALMLTGWYIESNLIERHQQGHGIVDLKCGGNVVRFNSVLDSPGGRIDARNGSNNVFESNWMENSGGSNIRGGHNKIVGNYVHGGQIAVMAGEFEWNMAGGGYPRAYDTLIAGNDMSGLYIGKANNDNSTYPALDTIVEGNSGPQPQLGRQQNTTIRQSTSATFSAPFKLNSGRVGPAAMRQATAAYLSCRAP